MFYHITSWHAIKSTTGEAPCSLIVIGGGGGGGAAVLLRISVHAWIQANNMN